MFAWMMAGQERRVGILFEEQVWTSSSWCISLWQVGIDFEVSLVIDRLGHMAMGHFIRSIVVLEQIDRRTPKTASSSKPAPRLRMPMGQRQGIYHGNCCVLLPVADWNSHLTSSWYRRGWPIRWSALAVYRTPASCFLLGPSSYFQKTPSTSSLLPSFIHSEFQYHYQTYKNKCYLE